jgi:hypothetical protein
MQQHTSTPGKETVRRDTLSLRTIVRYDPAAPRPTTPILVGKHVVARKPLADSVHTLYMILDGATVVGTSISAPDEHDCASAISRHRRASAALLAKKAIANAKQRKPRAFRIREAA